jgi:hypothetical protein
MNPLDILFDLMYQSSAIAQGFSTVLFSDIPFVDVSVFNVIFSPATLFVVFAAIVSKKLIPLV